MWLDETFSMWLANHSVSDMLQWTAQPSTTTLLLLLHYWIALNGDTPYYARLLSVLFGVRHIPVIYLIGKRLSGVLVGLVAAVFLAFSPFNIYFAQETRMYTLLTFNAAVAIYALVRLLTDSRSVCPMGRRFREYLHAWRTAGPMKPDATREFSYQDETRNQTGWRAWIFRHRWLPIQTIETDLVWVTFIVFSAATLFSHNTAVFFLLASNIFVLGQMFYQRQRNLVLHPPCGPLFWELGEGSAWHLHLVVSLAIGLYSASQPGRSGVLDSETRLGHRDPDASNLLNASLPDQGSQVIIMWILCAVLCLGLVYYRKKLSIFLLLVTLFAVPFLGGLLVSIHRPIFLGKTLIWITIPVFLLLAAGIAQLKFRLLMLVVLGF